MDKSIFLEGTDVHGLKYAVNLKHISFIRELFRRNDLEDETRSVIYTANSKVYLKETFNEVCNTIQNIQSNI